MILTWSLFMLAALSSRTLAVNTKMKEVFTWKTVDFDFPTDASRRSALSAGTYDPKNNLPLGLDVWRDRVFVTVPRWKTGVASTLNYVLIDPQGRTTSPKLIPYPDWESNHLPAEEGHQPNKTSIISVFRVQVDACDRLWVMDTGLADITGTPKVYFGPQILIYDLNTNKLIKTHSFKDTDIKELSFFANINVDADKDNCEDAFAYIPDLGGYGVIVYSLKEDDSWRIKHNFFHFDPLNGDFNIGGVNFQWTDGVFSFALSPRGEDGYKTAYFHALAAVHEFQVSTRILRNKTIASDSYYEYKILGSRGKDGQSSASVLDPKTGVLFYTQVNRDGVGCWNSNEETYTPENQALVTQDNETFIFPNDLKVDREDNVWVLTDKLPVFIYRELDAEQANYRIFRAPVQELIKDTVCEGNRRRLSRTPTVKPPPGTTAKATQRPTTTTTTTPTPIVHKPRPTNRPKNQ